MAQVHIKPEWDWRLKEIVERLNRHPTPDNLSFLCGYACALRDLQISLRNVGELTDLYTQAAYVVREHAEGL